MRFPYYASQETGGSAEMLHAHEYFTKPSLAGLALRLQ